MGCHCGFHNAAKGCLALECVVLFESHTSTARSFVLASALWVWASWIPPSPRMCASTPLSPAALTFKRYSKMKWRQIWRPLRDEALVFLGGKASLESHSIDVASQKISEATLNIPWCVSLLLPKRLSIPSSPIWWCWTTAVTSVLHTSWNEWGGFCFVGRKPSRFAVDKACCNGFYLAVHCLRLQPLVIE